MLRHPCTLGGPQQRGQNPKSKPTLGVTIRIGCLTPAFSGAHKWAEMLHNPCILGDTQTKRDKIRIGYSPLPSRGLTSGQKCYIVVV